MTNANDLAFARPSTGHLESFVEGSEGLTKLEYFAGLAMQGMLANDWQGYADREEECDVLAKCAVNYAKALIEQLNNK